VSRNFLVADFNYVNCFTDGFLIKEGLLWVTGCLNALIDKITVSERYRNAEGALEQTITIYYKFVGSLHEHYIAVPKRITHMEEKRCTRCGDLYMPQSNVSQYCPDCHLAMRKIYAARANEVRKAKRGSVGLVPKPCGCCGKVFEPKAHNAQFCPACFPEARAQAAKQWSKENYQKKKARAAV